MSMMPRIVFIAGPSILSSMNIAAVEKIANAARICRRRFQFTCLTYWIITTVEDVSESRPERVTASAYEGIKNGSAVMMNIPNPKPMVLCMKLAPAASRNISMLNSISDALYKTK